MNRDGLKHSLWQDTTIANANNNIPASEKYDVIIAGGGITGITTGLLLQKAGKSVLIAEAKTIGFGTSGGTTAHLNTFMDTSYDIVQQKFDKQTATKLAAIVQGALDLIQQNVTEYNIECNHRTLPGYLFSQEKKQSEELDKIISATQESGVACEPKSKLPVPIPFEKIAMFPGQATFHPTRYLTALAAAFQQAGGTILENCRVTNVKDDKEECIVETTHGTFKSRKFIYSTHIPPGVNLLHFRCAPYRSYAIAAILKDGDKFDDALVYDMYDPYHYYRFEEVDGKRYLIAGGEDHKTGHETNTEQCFRQLEAHVRKYFDIEEIAYSWSSQYFEPNDGLPYIGYLPSHPDSMFVATGFGGNGMIYSAVSAIILSDMIVKGQNDYWDIFNPNRVSIVAGFSNFVKEAADVTGKLIGKLILPSKKMKEFSELSPGDAAVVKYEGHKVAVYKDEQGKLFPLHAACTHIKCDVAWNNAEKSWDCPCHGSRFHFTGEMLTGPARKDLETIDLSGDDD